MLSVHLICVGKLKEKFYLAACAEYQKRLGAYCKLELTELSEERLPQNPSRAQIDAALEREAAAIRGKIPPNSCLVALCVEGKQLSSEELAGWIEKQGVGGCGDLAFVIGSSHGLAPAVKQAAALRFSMGRITLPHQLARLVLCEQIYRAFSINAGSKYHK